jgi:hypothetical protein
MDDTPRMAVSKDGVPLVIHLSGDEDNCNGKFRHFTLHTYQKSSSVPHPFTTYFSASDPEPESPLAELASPSLAVYSDAAHGDCKVSGKSTGGYLVMMNGSPVQTADYGLSVYYRG